MARDHSPLLLTLKEQDYDLDIGSVLEQTSAVEQKMRSIRPYSIGRVAVLGAGTMGAAGGEQLLDGGGDGHLLRAHLRDDLFKAGRIPQGKRSQLPVETSSHRAIDINQVFSDFADAVGSVRP